MREEDKIELRSEEFQEVLGSVPHWILRRGITLLAIIVVILLVGSAIFKYPDIISARVTLTGSTPPATIVAKTTGKLNELYVRDNQEVKSGDFLGVIENSAQTKDILTLTNYLEGINIDSVIILPPKHLSLGSLQTVYSSFYLILFEYTEYQRLEYLPAKEGILRERIKKYETQYQNLIKQRRIVEEQLILIKNQYSRDSTLNKKGIIANQELELTRSQYLQRLLSYEEITSSIDNAQMQIGQIQESLFDTNYQDIEKENTLKTRLRTLITQLQADLETWKLTYVLSAPINGKITFTNYWTINQNIIAGDQIFNIIPDNAVNMLGKASLPIARSGKVEIGQKVNIRFDNFPDHEYGMIKGIVKNISLVPTSTKENAEYMVEIDIPNDLKTTYNKKLPYFPGMTGQADIITKDVSLLERFFMPLRKAVQEGFE